MAKLKILFWNIQRSAAKKQSLPTDMLTDDLAGLTTDAASERRPDMVILCEANEGFEKNQSMLPDGWEYVDQGSRNLYTPNMLRYVVMQRAGLGCTANLLDTRAAAKKNNKHLRPALGIHANEVGFIALHAYSNPGQPSTQIQQMIVAHNEFEKWKTNESPLFLIGDFNIDYSDGDRRSAVKGGLDKTPLLKYNLRGPRDATHEKGKTLDWALIKAGTTVSINKITPMTPEEAQREQQQRKYLTVFFTNRKQADHTPILATVG